MKKLIVSACVALIAALNVVAGKIWEVYPDVKEGKTGPEQLLEAFGGLSSGDTVLIHEGEYDLTSIKMSDSTHLTVSQPCTICGDTDGHWDDKVLFTGTLQAIGLTADVAVKISGITFYGFALGANKGVVAFKEYYDATSDSHGDECYLTNCVIRSCTANTCAGIYRGYAKDCLIENNVAGQESIGENTRLDDCVVLLWHLRLGRPLQLRVFEQCRLLLRWLRQLPRLDISLVVPAVRHFELPFPVERERQ